MILEVAHLRRQSHFMYYNNVLDLIGNTPLMCLQESTGYNIFAKAEFLNPGGSIKDRIAKI